jgi:hypothetical protein
MRLAEQKKIVPVMATTDYNNGAVGDSINMAGYIRATFIILFGAITGDSVLTVNSGATNAAKTSAMTFHYALGGAAIGTAVAGSVASCDVLAADATSAALTLTAATYANKMLVVDVDASDMDTANEENWLTIDIDATASAGIAYCIAVLEPRQTSNRSVTALA